MSSDVASSLATFKLVSALLTLAVGWSGVALPWLLRRSERLLSLGNMLSAGTMLGGGLLHLLPDAAETIAPVAEFPVGYLLFALGLLLPLVVETLAVDGRSHKKSAKRGGSEWLELETHGPVKGSDDSVTSEDALTSERLDDAEQHDHDHGAALAKLPLSSALVLLLALSFHSVLEGLAQGSAATMETGALLLLIILLHKGLAAFALGCLFYDAQLTRASSLGLGAIFAAATPAGTLVGMLLPASEEGAEAVLPACFVALAGGSFTFVALIEILPRELHGNRGGVSKHAKLAALGVGFGAMALLAFWL